MSNDSKVKNFIVTKKDIEKFITQRLLLAGCPDCKKNIWSLEGGGEDQSVMIYIQKASLFGYEKQPRVQSVSCYALICVECGYARTYAKYAVHKWKEKNKKKKRRKS